jgi:hypothetical protein
MRGRIVILALLVAVLAGCGPKLQAVRVYSETALKVNAQAASVIADFNASCERQFVLEEKNNIEKRSSKLNSEGGKKNDKANNNKDETDEANSYLQFKTEMHCANHRKATEGVLAALQILNNYLAALGALAADNPVKYQAPLANAKTAVSSAVDSNNNPLFTDHEKIGGFFSLADFVIGAGIRYYQQKELKEYIKVSFKHVSASYSAIIRVIEENYLEELETEKSSTKRIMRRNRITQLEEAKKDMDINEFDTLVYLLKVIYSKEEQKINLRQQNADSVIANLKNTQATLESIYNNINGLDSEFVIGLISDYYTTVKPKLEAAYIIQ